LHTQLRRAAMERDLSQFAAAAELFRAALVQQQRLERDGRLENLRTSNVDSRTLGNEIAFCTAAPRALSDPSFARSKSVVVRARLLLLRARTLTDHQVAETARAIRELDADLPDDQYDVARCLGQLINDLNSPRWPDLSRRQRLAIGAACADRAAAILVQAEERGFRDVGRLEREEFAGLRQHPVYQSLLARLKRSSEEGKPPKAGAAPG
jgi:hypothetical protein